MFPIGFYFFLLSDGSRAGINSDSMCFYRLPLDMEFPHAPDPL